MQYMSGFDLFYESFLFKSVSRPNGQWQIYIETQSLTMNWHQQGLVKIESKQLQMYNINVEFESQSYHEYM